MLDQGIHRHTQAQDITVCPANHTCSDGAERHHLTVKQCHHLSALLFAGDWCELGASTQDPESLPEVQNNGGLRLLLIDNVAAFYWLDRDCKGTHARIWSAHQQMLSLSNMPTPDVLTFSVQHVL